MPARQSESYSQTYRTTRVTLHKRTQTTGRTRSPHATPLPLHQLDPGNGHFLDFTARDKTAFTRHCRTGEPPRLAPVKIRGPFELVGLASGRGGIESLLPARFHSFIHAGVWGLSFTVIIREARLVAGPPQGLALSSEGRKSEVGSYSRWIVRSSAECGGSESEKEQKIQTNTNGCWISAE